MEGLNYNNTVVPKTDEDVLIHFEGITTKEKQLLNIIRNFKGNDWLQAYISEQIETVMSSLVTKSIEERAIRHILKELDENKIEKEQAYNRFVKVCDSIVSDDNEMTNLSNCWYDTIIDTIYGELTPIEE